MSANPAAIAGAYVGGLVEFGWRMIESRFRFSLRDWLLFSALVAFAGAVLLASARFAFEGR